MPKALIMKWCLKNFAHVSFYTTGNLRFTIFWGDNKTLSSGSGSLKLFFSVKQISYSFKKKITLIQFCCNFDRIRQIKKIYLGRYFRRWSSLCFQVDFWKLVWILSNFIEVFIFVSQHFWKKLMIDFYSVVNHRKVKVKSPDD